MNEIQSVDTLTAEILILKQQTAQNIVEIGKRLIAVKESLPHGEWGKWLQEKVDFTDRTAQRFMKVANEISNTTTLSDLPKSKVFALLDLPSEEREAFIQNNPVNEMTTRELQQAIKEKEEALKKANEFKLSAAEQSQRAMKLQEEKNKAETEKKISEKVLRDTQKDVEMLQDALKQERESSKKEIDRLQLLIADTKKLLNEAKNSGNNEEVEKLQASLNKTEQGLIDSQNKIEELERQLKEKPIDVITAEAEPQIIEKIPEEVERELQELREKLKQPQGNENLIKFKINFDKTVSSVKDMLGSLAEIREVDEAEYEKYRKAAAGLLNKILERL